MLPVEAARTAARAEILHERLRMQRLARWVLGVVVACVLVTAALAALHLAAWYALADAVGPKVAGLLIAAGDLVLAFLALAAASRGGLLEQQAIEAAELRNRALGEAGRAVSLLTVAAPLLALLRGRGRLGAALAAAAGALLFRRR